MQTLGGGSEHAHLPSQSRVFLFRPRSVYQPSQSFNSKTKKRGDTNKDRTGVYPASVYMIHTNKSRLLGRTNFPSRMDERAQEIFEYSRRGRTDELVGVVGKVHPDSFVAYDGSTAFLMACRNGHLSVCELLLKHGADMSIRTDDGSTALLLATCAGRIGIVSLILPGRLCDINEVNEDGFTPLDMALHYSHVEIAQLLRSHGGRTSGVYTPETGEVAAGPSEKWGYGVFDQ